MLSLGTNYFGVLDYLSVTLTLIISLGIGVYHAFKGRGKQTSEDLLMGGRQMSVIPIACSMLVTYLSAISIIGKQILHYLVFINKNSKLSKNNLHCYVESQGYPAEIYSNGIQFFFMGILIIFICIPLTAYIFMSVLYKLKLTSVYEVY